MYLFRWDMDHLYYLKTNVWSNFNFQYCFFPSIWLKTIFKSTIHVYFPSKAGSQECRSKPHNSFHHLLLPTSTSNSRRMKPGEEDQNPTHWKNFDILVKIKNAKNTIINLILIPKLPIKKRRSIKIQFKTKTKNRTYAMCDRFPFVFDDPLFSSFFAFWIFCDSSYIPITFKLSTKVSGIKLLRILMAF